MNYIIFLCDVIYRPSLKRRYINQNTLPADTNLLTNIYLNKTFKKYERKNRKEKQNLNFGSDVLY